MGNIPQAKGLGVSLLERLHSVYDKLSSSISELCSVTLLTNYRSHSGILMFLSSLYYQSTLLCRVSDSVAHHLAPFPLAFVCSDIRRGLEMTSGVNKDEAKILINEVKKYFTKWPKHWSKEKSDKRICIMSSSANQVLLHNILCSSVMCQGTDDKCLPLLHTCAISGRLL